MTSPVRVRSLAKFFFEGERKFFVKGVTYGPFRPDVDGHYLGSQEQARREALKLGAHSVHTTPYDPVELLRSVRLAGSAEVR